MINQVANGNVTSLSQCEIFFMKSHYLVSEMMISCLHRCDHLSSLALKINKRASWKKSLFDLLDDVISDILFNVSLSYDLPKGLLFINQIPFISFEILLNEYEKSSVCLFTCQQNIDLISNSSDIKFRWLILISFVPYLQRNAIWVFWGEGGGGVVCKS